MKPLSILIVDDDRDFGQSLANFLRMEGHEVELAFDWVKDRLGNVGQWRN